MPVGFAVIIIVSLLTPAPKQETQELVEHVRYPNLKLAQGLTQQEPQRSRTWAAFGRPFFMPDAQRTMPAHAMADTTRRFEPARAS